MKMVAYKLLSKELETKDKLNYLKILKCENTLNKSFSNRLLFVRGPVNNFV